MASRPRQSHTSLRLVTCDVAPDVQNTGIEQCSCRRGPTVFMKRTSMWISAGRVAGTRAGRRRLAMALTLFLGSPATSQAQMAGGQVGGGRGGRHKGQQQSQQTAPPPPPVIVPEPWPRLDSGAIFCRSQADLVRYQTDPVAGAGTREPSPAPDCHVIQQRTVIQILERDGPSRTHVVFSGAEKQSGWTNAYLPSKPPPSAIASATNSKQ
jgi:hypothetical protein